MVRVNGLHTQLGPTLVHAGLTLHVPRGVFAALIGPSGCGKTTLLRVLAGLLPGEVEVQGRTALVFQQPTLLPWLTVLDNAVLGMEARGTTDRDRARDLLVRMGLNDVLDARPAALSLGMQQRVNLARAWLVDPDVLLLDEPFSALDALTRHRLHLELLALVQERGVTVVMASHALDEVALLADVVHVLSDRPCRVVAVHGNPNPHPRTDRAALAHFQDTIADSLTATTGRES